MLGPEIQNHFLANWERVSQEVTEIISLSLHVILVADTAREFSW